MFINSLYICVHLNIYRSTLKNKLIKKCMGVPGAHRQRGGGAAGPIRPWLWDICSFEKNERRWIFSGVYIQEFVKGGGAKI